MSSAASRWRRALEQWAIPDESLAAAPESPWTFPTELFASRADAAMEDPSPSAARASEALRSGGSVLDVGSGAGAASLPLAVTAGRITAVDTSPAMLDAFRDRATRVGIAHDAVVGAWPDVAAAVPAADVVVCNHVLYNVAHLGPFVVALTAHAHSRVVVELTPRHPASDLNPLWLRFHGLMRPTEPTADDAVAVIREVLGVEPARDDWMAPARGSLRREDMVAWIRRRLCLTADRDPEVAAAIADRLVEQNGRVSFGPRPLVTLWWPGTAP